ncbi:MAG: autorepressor SdpR family transcription factor [Oscillospiraceae bacterium]|jgi:DNA-binding transcriptional ArsR family regulator|nr:autorepressor SdpR family transcription factor [Oscillospiraceae bacterium]
MGIHESFKALSDPVRREILAALKGGRLPAGEIASRFGLTGATISYHLSRLKDADLVHETKRGNFVYYELNTTVFDDMVLWFGQFRKGKTQCLTDV